MNKKEKHIISNIKYYNINTIRRIKFNVVNKTIYIKNVNAVNNEYLSYIIKENTKYNILNKYIKNISESTDCIGSTNYIVISKNIIKIRVMLNSIIDKLVMKYRVYEHRITQSFNIYHMFLNFKKNRFFPYFYKGKGKDTIFNNSLGILSKKFSHKKSFLKSKNAYLFSSSYIRRMLIYISTTKLNLNIRKTPKYLKEILRVLTSDSNVIYNHPFHKSVVNEKEKSLTIKFLYINFTNNKSLGPVKKNKKGRLKRKISKKIILYNNVLD